MLNGYNYEPWLNSPYWKYVGENRLSAYEKHPFHIAEKRVPEYLILVSLQWNFPFDKRDPRTSIRHVDVRGYRGNNYLVESWDVPEFRKFYSKIMEDFENAVAKLCKCTKTKVVANYSRTYRRRICLDCGRSFFEDSSG